MRSSHDLHAKKNLSHINRCIPFFYEENLEGENTLSNDGRIGMELDVFSKERNRNIVARNVKSLSVIRVVSDRHCLCS